MSSGARRLVHYSGFVQPLIVTAAGIACLVALFLWLNSGEPVETEGIIGLSLLGLAGLGFGGYSFWRHSGQDATAPIQTVDDLPPTERARQTRNAIWFFAVASFLGTAFMVHQLMQVEFGSAQRVTVWAPVAIIYDFFGFWPAVLFVPVLGLAIILVLASKLRAIREGQTGRV